MLLLISLEEMRCVPENMLCKKIYVMKILEGIM